MKSLDPDSLLCQMRAAGLGGSKPGKPASHSQDHSDNQACRQEEGGTAQQAATLQNSVPG